MLPNYTPDTDTDFSETQLKKMFRAFLNGNEHSLKWNEILKSFCDLPEARQRKALEKLPLESFLSIQDTVNCAYEDTFKAQVASRKEKRAKTEAILAIMQRDGISLDDLLGSNHAASRNPKHTYQSREFYGLSEKENEIFSAMLAQADADNLVILPKGMLPKLLDKPAQWISNGIAKLREKGFIERVEGRNNQYKVLKAA